MLSGDSFVADLITKASSWERLDPGIGKAGLKIKDDRHIDWAQGGKKILKLKASRSMF